MLRAVEEYSNRNNDSRLGLNDKMIDTYFYVIWTTYFLKIAIKTSSR